MLNKKQKRNRKIIKFITIFLLFFEIFLSFGIAGNIDLDIPIQKWAIISYIINTIILFINIYICKLANINI